MSNLFGSVSVTPVKRKELTSSSSDNTPSLIGRSKKQEKKRRRKQKKLLLSETPEEASVMSNEQASSTEQNNERAKEPIDYSSVLADIRGQLRSLKTVEEDVGELKGQMKRLVDSLTNRIEILETDSHNLKDDNDKLRKALNVTKQQNEELKAELDAQKERLKQNEKKQNDHEQHGRLQNLRVFGVPEPAGQGKETKAECREKVVKIFQEKLGVDIGAKQIEVAHRVGSVAFAKANNRVRPIIVRFMSREDRDTVMTNRKKLKGAKISVGEDLTTTNLRLLKRLEEHSGTMSAWSARGNIFAKLLNGLIVKVDMLSDVNKVVEEGVKRGRSGGGGQPGENDFEMN